MGIRCDHILPASSLNDSPEGQSSLTALGRELTTSIMVVNLGHRTPCSELASTATSRPGTCRHARVGHMKCWRWCAWQAHHSAGARRTEVLGLMGLAVACQSP